MGNPPQNIMMNEKNVGTKMYVHFCSFIWNCTKIGKNNLVIEIRLVVPLAPGMGYYLGRGMREPFGMFQIFCFLIGSRYTHRMTY